MWFKLQPITLTEARKGPVHLKTSQTFNAPATTVYGCFSSDEHMPKWFQELRHAEWKTEPMVGGLRQLNLLPMNLKERFLVVEPNQHLAFYFEEMTLPFFKWVVEEFTFEDNGDDTSQFTWQMYWELKPAFKLLTPVFKLVMKNVAVRGTNGLGKYVESF